MQVSNSNPLAALFGSAKTGQAKPQPTGFFAAPQAEHSKTKAELLDRARMTPAQQMRASILDSMGLKEEDLKGMSTEKRQEVERKIEEMIRTKVEQAQEKNGGLLDIKA